MIGEIWDLFIEMELTLLPVVADGKVLMKSDSGRMESERLRMIVIQSRLNFGLCCSSFPNGRCRRTMENHSWKRVQLPGHNSRSQLTLSDPINSNISTYVLISDLWGECLASIGEDDINTTAMRHYCGTPIML
jgi:hypothetical protein